MPPSLLCRSIALSLRALRCLQQRAILMCCNNPSKDAGVVLAGQAAPLTLPPAFPLHPPAQHDPDFRLDSMTAVSLQATSGWGATLVGRRVMRTAAASLPCSIRPVVAQMRHPLCRRIVTSLTRRAGCGLGWQRRAQVQRGCRKGLGCTGTGIYHSSACCSLRLHP
jgi:hypothetical protein